MYSSKCVSIYDRRVGLSRFWVFPCKSYLYIKSKNQNPDPRLFGLWEFTSFSSKPSGAGKEANVK